MPAAGEAGQVSEGHGVLHGPQGSGKSASAETVQIGASNAEPTFDDGAATRAVEDYISVGTIVGAVVSAMDSDGGDPLHYSLSGTDATSFTIVSTSGQKRAMSGTKYNYESENGYG